jgi:hypothetical protein
MRGRGRRVGIGAVVVASAALIVPAAASAAVLDVYSELAELDRSPAPLVPTTLPPVLRPADRTIGERATGGGRRYLIRVARPGAVVVVAGDQYRSMRPLLRERRRQGYRARGTRIRGQRGYLLKRSLGPDSYELAWVERGVVQSVATGTARNISVAALRRIAARLERVGGSYLGSSSDPESGTGGTAVTTERTVTLYLDFQGTCADTTVRGGSASVTLLPRQGDGFAFDIARQRGSGRWEGTVTGTVSSSAITLDVRPTGTFDGMSCSGAETLVLERR